MDAKEALDRMLAGAVVVVSDGLSNPSYYVDDSTGDIVDSDGLEYTDDEFLEAFSELSFDLA
jgi:coenzyme F420-reducing hydrogenase beta subunit